MESKQTDHEYDFDVAVSFAGEDRDFVEAVVTQVKAAGHSVFYDEDSEATLWGEELTEYFGDVYENRARFAVMFVSAHYARKPWTRLERRSIMTRAMNQASPYLLPVRLDTTALPGVRATVSYLDGLRRGPDGVVDALLKKLGTPAATGSFRRFNDRVPRNEQEASILLAERPPSWEYLLFSWLVSSKLQQYEDEYRDHRMRFALPSSYATDREAIDKVLSSMSFVGAIATTFDRLLLGPAQTEAFGAPGESGDPALIEHLASRCTLIYGELLKWARDLRSQATESEESSAVLEAAAEYVSQPIEAIRDFAVALQADLDELPDRLAKGENITIEYKIKFEVPEGISYQLDAARRAFARRMGIN